MNKDQGRYIEQGKRLHFYFDRGHMALDTLTDQVFRLQIQHEGAPRKQPTPAIQCRKEIARTCSSGESAYYLLAQEQPLQVSLHTKDRKPLLQTQPHSQGWSHTKTSITFSLSTQHAVHGLGEKVGGLDKRGNTYTMYNTDVLPHIPSTDPLYLSIPFLFQNTGHGYWGLYLDHLEPSYFDVGNTQHDLLTIEVESPSLDLYLLAARDVQELLSLFKHLTGAMDMPPKYALGYQQSRWGYSSEKLLKELAGTFRQKKIPCDIVYMDLDYMDGYKSLTWNTEAFPKPKELLSELKEDGFQVVTIVNPGVKEDPQYYLYRELTDGGFYIKNEENTGPYQGKVWPGDCIWPDFFNPRAQAWWQEKIKDFVGYGLGGIWHDMTEPAVFYEDGTGDMAYNARHYDGALHRKIHNYYNNAMGQATQAGLLDARPGERPFILTRAGFAGIQSLAALWTGDNCSWWEHLAMAIPMCLNLGLSGIPFSGPDIGGFFYDTNRELFIRWIQAGVFFPFCRNHSGQDTRQQEPWQFGPEAEDIAREFITLRYRLLPTLYSLFHEAGCSGAPIMRPLFWEFPEDPVAREIQDSFLLGPSLLIGPVLHQGQRHKNLYLPSGPWYSWWDHSQRIGPGPSLEQAPLHRIPLFVRGGSILALGPAILHTGANPQDQVTLYLYPQGQSSFTLYEDDGHSLAYREGAYTTTRYTLQSHNSTLTLHQQVDRNGYKVKRDTLDLFIPGQHGDEVLWQGTPLPQSTALKPKTWKNTLEGMQIRLPQTEETWTLQCQGLRALKQGGGKS